MCLMHVHQHAGPVWRRTAFGSGSNSSGEDVPKLVKKHMDGTFKVAEYIKHKMKHQAECIGCD